MIFKIQAVKDDVIHTFLYDNEKNILSTENGFVFENKQLANFDSLKESFPFSPTNPLKKSRDVTTLKIQLGLSCNYSCEYCSQRFVERAEETNFKDIEDFLEKIKNLNFSERNGLKIEFWGGEPFVYWKTLKPLVEQLRIKFADWEQQPRFSVITNGSLLSEEINEWLLDNMDTMAISHDGPGQPVRGPDPFEDKALAYRILKLYNTVKSRTRRLQGMSFNSMLNSKNQSRKEIRDWFINFTGDPDVMIGEGGFVDSYDEGGIGSSLLTKQQQFQFRQKAFAELYAIPDNENIGYPIVITKINNFMADVMNHKQAKYVGQKCGMDDENTISVDLRGNVLTCQNVSAVDINSNGESHHSGNITDFDNVAVTTSTHWRERKECSGCPVLHICKGACMFVSGEYWHHSCANAYSDALVLFMIAFKKLTGYIPIFIDNDQLPDVRKDIFGTMLEHKEDEIKDFRTGRKPFPVAVVAA
jgi:uncharacterized protein